MAKEKKTEMELLEERLRTCAEWRERLSLLAKMVMQMQLDVERMEAEARALRTRSGIRVLD